MLIRHPVDRIVSEFTFQYHMLNGKNGNVNAAIISKLKPLPTTLEAYINFSNTHNYQIKFLLGRKIADPKPVTNSDYAKIIKSSAKRIDELEKNIIQLLDNQRVMQAELIELKTELDLQKQK